MKSHFVFIIACAVISHCSAQTNGIKVTLHMPGEQMLLVESSPILVTIFNNSGRSIPLAKAVGAALRFQVIFDIGAKNPQSDGGIYGVTDKYVSWKYRLSRSKDCIPNGENYTWKFNKWVELTEYAARIEATNISVRVMVGDSEWVRSEILPFCVSKADLQEAGLLEKSPLFESLDARTKMKTHLPIRKVKLGNKHFLFTNDGNRLCEIASDDTPEALFDSEKGELYISFFKSKKKILYIPKTGKVIQERDEK